MLRFSIMAIFFTSVCSLASAQEGDSDNEEFKTAAQKASYGIGLNIGRDMKRNAPLVTVEVDVRLLPGS